MVKGWTHSPLFIIAKSHVSALYAWLTRNGKETTIDDQGSAHQGIEKDRDLVKSADVLKLVKARDFSKVRSTVCAALKALVMYILKPWHMHLDAG